MLALLNQWSILFSMLSNFNMSNPGYKFNIFNHVIIYYIIPYLMPNDFSTSGIQYLFEGDA